MESVKRVVMASTSGVVGCRKRSEWSLWKAEGQGEIPNDDSAYCESIARHWPYYHSKILAEKRTLVGLVWEHHLVERLKEICRRWESNRK